MGMHLMLSRVVARLFFALVLFLFSFPTFAAIAMNGAAFSSADEDGATDQFIVKLRDPSLGQVKNGIQALAASSAVNLTYVRQMSGNSHVVKIPQRLKKLDADALARLMSLQPNVTSVEPDRRMYPQLLPNDPMFAQQWHYYEPAGGINLPSAWDITTGSNSIVVAVIDTGIRPHADLAGRLLPGYDFIDNLAAANDGNGRDSDPSDPGDSGCGKSSSTWHGTHVAGTIGAASNNSSGLSGTNWGSKILPLRVLGLCGGYTSDIIDALRWAAGISSPGVPLNTTPAQTGDARQRFKMRSMMSLQGVWWLSLLRATAIRTQPRSNPPVAPVWWQCRPPAAAETGPATATLEPRLLSPLPVVLARTACCRRSMQG